MNNLPYLGCKISLVSKSEIRYEGILYTIDTKESTVALAKVRSLGTEGRLTDRPVAPRDEVYEYIIFRASDIKDLHVCEAPKPQPVIQSGLPNDPAIVQVFHSASCVQFGQPFGNVCGVPPFQHLPSHLTYPQMQQALFAGHASGKTFSGCRLGSVPVSQRKNATSDAGVQVSTLSSPLVNGKDEKADSQEFSRPNSRDSSQTRQTAQPQRGGFSNRRFQRGRGGRRGRGRGRGAMIRTSDRLKFEGEYDFELANAEFIELETKLAKGDLGAETLADDETEEGVIAYDKQKSFFDNISCDASRLSKKIPRFDWRTERKLNVETFGVVSSNTWLRRRRGRGGFRRGARGRGAITTRVSGDAPKAVTFGDQLVTEVEIERPDTPVEIPSAEEIPTVEAIPKEVTWEEPSGEKKEEWNI